MIARKKSARQMLRSPALAKELSTRIRVAIARVGVSHTKLVESLGDFRLDTLSRITNGHATAIPMDMLVCLAEWAMAENISLEWLMTGSGPMEHTDLLEPHRKDSDHDNDKQG